MSLIPKVKNYKSVLKPPKTTRFWFKWRVYVVYCW